MDLTAPAVRADLVERLARIYAGRPVILGPGVLAAFTPTVAELRGHGCRVLVLATARGAGPVPGSIHRPSWMGKSTRAGVCPVRFRAGFSSEESGNAVRYDVEP